MRVLACEAAKCRKNEYSGVGAHTVGAVQMDETIVMPVPASLSAFLAHVSSLVQCGRAPCAESSGTLRVEVVQTLWPAPLRIIPEDQVTVVMQQLLQQLHPEAVLSAEADMQLAITQGCWDRHSTLCKAAAVLAHKLLADVDPPAVREALQTEGLQDCLQLCAAGGRDAIVALCTSAQNWPEATDASEVEVEDGSVVALATRILANTKTSQQLRLMAVHLLWTMSVTVAARHEMAKYGVVQSMAVVMAQLVKARTAPGATPQMLDVEQGSQTTHQKAVHAQGQGNVEDLLKAVLSTLAVMVTDRLLRAELLGAGAERRAKWLEFLMELASSESTAESTDVVAQLGEIAVTASAVVGTMLARDSAARHVCIAEGIVEQLCALLDSPLVLVQLNAVHALAAFVCHFRGAEAQLLGAQLLAGDLAGRIMCVLHRHVAEAGTGGMALFPGQTQQDAEAAMLRLGMGLEAAVHAVVRAGHHMAVRAVALRLVNLARHCMKQGCAWNNMLAVRFFSYQNVMSYVAPGQHATDACPKPNVAAVLGVATDIRQMAIAVFRVCVRFRLHWDAWR
jgi:hypothetical protein